MKFAACSDIGKVRNDNEDAYLATGQVFAVADGMGGHQAGEVASATALQTLKERLEKTKKAINRNLVVQSFQEANKAVYRKAIEKPEQRGMGTTLTAIFVQNENFFIGHIGDSRAYLLRETKLKKLTEDHALVAEMVKEGKIPPEELKNHPLRSVLTRALGTEPKIEIDFISQKVVRGDKLLLCTDGLSSMLNDEEIEKIAGQAAEPQDICHQLIDAANLNGGLDNITVVLVDFD